jgi:hypothetical protein
MICCLPLALLAIVAGLFLLAYTKKENLDHFYKYFAWFVVIMGLLCILGCAFGCAMKMCRMGHERMMMREKMMDGMMMHRMGSCEMMDEGYCDGMNRYDGMRGNCNDGMMNGCHEGMMGGQCHDGMMGSCKGDMDECHMGNGGGSCPMMKEEIKKDTVIKKK